MGLYVETILNRPMVQKCLYVPLILAGQFLKAQISNELLHNQEPELQEVSGREIPMLFEGGGKLNEWMQLVAGKALSFCTLGKTGNITLRRCLGVETDSQFTGRCHETVP